MQNIYSHKHTHTKGEPLVKWGKCRVLSYENIDHYRSINSLYFRYPEHFCVA